MYFNDDQLSLLRKRGFVFRHFKGTEYVILHFAVDHTNGDTPTHVVVYANTNPEDSMVFVRDLREFFSEVDHEKYPDVVQTWRFDNGTL